MRKMAISVIAVLILLTSCTTVQQNEISSYYSMVYDIWYDAFSPVAEEHIKTGDRVLIISMGQGFNGTMARYEFKQDETAEAFVLPKYLDDRPFFTEYFEKGLVKSIIDNQGRGFEKLTLPPPSSDPKLASDVLSDWSLADWYIDEDLVFNTNPLDFEDWEELKKTYNVNKVLMYTVNRVVEKDNDYLGIQVGVKLIDADEKGLILHDTIENVVSVDYPDDKMKLLHRYYLDVPSESLTGFQDKLSEVLSDEGIRGGIDAVMIKNDDISTLGNYPVTIEDFILEQTLTNSLTSGDTLNILEKLSKRQYKKNWQLSNAIFNLNPLMGGEYSEFEGYYNTQYMLSYKTLFAEQTGEIKEISDDKVELNKKILGVHLKLIDMADHGRIVMSHFLPLASQNDLDSNFLYKSFNRVNELSLITDALEEQSVLADSEKAVVINERMEIFKHHLLSNYSAYEYMFNLFKNPKNAAILTEYEKLYKLLDSETAGQTNGDIYYIMATHIMNSWFEEGLNNLLVNQGYYVVDKLESFYSRYLITEKYKRGGNASTNIFLSPLLLEEWGSDIKDVYDIDKILYYIPMEKAVKDGDFVTPGTVASQTTSGEISQYYPILSYELEKMLFSILDIQTGDYLFNRNFDLEGGN
ncbi:MAG: hypothetical protein PQJ58_07430 [Spirochaetales bacterium]|nr:hypothetical protein [Spirochaetales bacterium]